MLWKRKKEELNSISQIVILRRTARTGIPLSLGRVSLGPVQLNVVSSFKWKDSGDGEVPHYKPL